jgi:hypothetical protein
MASFQAYLEVAGQKYPLYRYDFSVYQVVDALSRPASPVLGGKLLCTLAASAQQDSLLTQWMLSPTMQCDGVVRLMRADAKATEKTITFENAYCIGLNFQFTPGQQGHASSLLDIEISPQRVSVGSILHDNRWPIENGGGGSGGGVGADSGGGIAGEGVYEGTQARKSMRAMGARAFTEGEEGGILGQLTETNYATHERTHVVQLHGPDSLPKSPSGTENTPKNPMGPSK